MAQKKKGGEKSKTQKATRKANKVEPKTIHTTKAPNMTDEQFEQRGKDDAEQRAKLRIPHIAKTPTQPPAEKSRELVQTGPEASAALAVSAQADASTALTAAMSASLGATQQAMAPGVAMLNGVGVLLDMAGQIARHVGTVATTVDAPPA